MSAFRQVYTCFILYIHTSMEKEINHASEQEINQHHISSNPSEQTQTLPEFPLGGSKWQWEDEIVIFSTPPPHELGWHPTDD